MAIYKFFCDESYDSDPQQDTTAVYEIGEPYVPRTYVVAGFFSDEYSWADIENRWTQENETAGVARYHGVHVNARTGEFNDWSKDKQISYSKNLVTILRDQKRRLHAVSCGMFARDYRETISESGRAKFGSPYIACFKTCISMIANEMEGRNFEPEDQFAVILDRNKYELEAVDVFYKMKDSVEWLPHRRLATCVPGSWEDFVPLQPADLIAYETFRLLHEKHRGSMAPVRKALQSMFGDNGFLGHYYERDTFQILKEPLEDSVCVPNGFIVNFPLLPEEPDALGPQSDK